jgi:flavin reductase (DIM6/NTAB) family NADH-FMN oxidoreductase RutF
VGTTAVGHLVIHPNVLYVGTPVILVCTLNADGTTNLAPASSYWALGQMLVIGLESDGQSAANVLAHPELTVNLPSPQHWRGIEAIADTTAKSPVPESKALRYRHASDKFALADFSAEPSEVVAPARVAECDLQIEAKVLRTTPGVGDYFMVEAHVERVHASPSVVIPGTDHVDPRAWQPLIYNFRHYFALGRELGHRPGSALAATDGTRA